MSAPNTQAGIEAYCAAADERHHQQREAARHRLNQRLLLLRGFLILIAGLVCVSPILYLEWR